VPDANRAAQRPGQVIPRGALVTVPRPRVETASETTAGANVAVTCFAPSIVSGQSAELEQAPLQWRKREPAAAVACRVTWVASSQPIEQTAGHEIPGTVLATAPCPWPASVTASSCSGAPTCESHGESWTSNQLPAWP
jgi:hypothetical protein